MSRSPTLYLQDTREGCQKIESYTRNMSFDEFAADSRTIDAVARNLGVVGEAVKRLPPRWRESHREIEWRKIAGRADGGKIVGTGHADDVSREAIIVAYPADRGINYPTLSVYVYGQGEGCDIFTGEWHSPPISFEEYMRKASAIGTRSRA